MKPTPNWQTDDPLTLQHEHVTITGKAFRFKRQSDGKEFVKVRITSGPKAGDNVWPDAPWALGTGPHAFRCQQCGQDARSEDATEIFCLACLRTLDQSRTAEPAGRLHDVRWRSEERGRGRRHF